MSQPTIDELYLREIETQCGYADYALQDCERYLFKDTQDTRRFWYSIQSLLIAIANISKILWPLAEFSDRGRRLRQRLRIEDDSCLRSRDFRNHFEHYDERVQVWFDSPPAAGFADFCIGGDDSFGGGLNKPHFMRNFNPKSLSLYFRGEAYQLRPVIEALHTLQHRTCLEL